MIRTSIYGISGLELLANKNTITFQKYHYMNISQLKNHAFKRTIVLATAFFVLCSAVPRIFTNADFSGEWKLNEGKSDLGQFGGRGAARKLKISAEADALNLERTSQSPSGEDVTSKEK
ncbi:MAG: hypothetical protein ACJ749_08175, partial [Flavisolibacter sp.]